MTRRRCAVAVLLGLAGAVLGVWLFADVRVDAGPVDLRGRLVPSWGGQSELVIGALGHARADTHDGFFSLVVTTEALDRGSVADVVSGAGVRSVAPIDRGAVDAAGRRLLLLAAAGAILTGGLAAGLTLRSRRAGLVGAAAASGLVFATGALAATTLDTDAWRSPRLDGVVALAPQTAGDLLARNDALGDRVADLAAGLARLHEQVVATTLSAGAGPTTDVRILVISDLHLNRAGLGLARRLADVYDVDAVVNLGDDTDWGSAQESEVLGGSAGFDAPYVWVRGNHDSRTTQAAVADGGAAVLDGDLVEVAGLSLYGIGDPTFTPAKTAEVIDAGETAYKAAWSERVFLPRYREDTAGRDVDMLLVHDVAMVDALTAVDLPPIVLSGHGHRFSVDDRDGTRFVAMGSTGGAGLRAFDDPDDVTPLTAGLLTIDLTGAEPTTIDVFSLEPYRGDVFSVQRYVLTAPQVSDPQRDAR